MLIEIKKGIFQDSEIENKLAIELSKEFFEPEPILEAIHEYTNKFFVDMQPKTENSVSVIFTQKDEQPFDKELVYNFANRVVDYQVRRNLEQEYKSIQNTIVEYAYSPVKKTLI